MALGLASRSLDGGNVKLTYIHKVTCNRRRRCHHWADKVSPAVFTLSPLKIAVRRTRRPLVRREDVGVHADAHAATRVAPLEACLAKDFVEALFFGLRFNSARTRHNQRLLDAVCHVLASHEMGRRAQVIKARIRA